jgi:hypothetical protein
VEIILFAILLGLIPAAIAKRKGYGFMRFWIYGALLFLFALPHALMLENDRQMQEENAFNEGAKQCCHCAEIIRPGALICQSCGINIFKDTGEPRFIVKRWIPPRMNANAGFVL